MITLITGTNRKSSKSSVMAHCLSAIYDEMGVENKVLELDQLPPETFSPDAYRDKPPKVLEFTQDILNRHLFVTLFLNQALSRIEKSGRTTTMGLNIYGACQGVSTKNRPVRCLLYNSPIQDNK